MTEAVSRSCSRVLPHHEWVSELLLGDASAWLKDGCVMLTCRVLVVAWAPLRYSAPTWSGFGIGE